jgi:hypothetical protein
VDAVSANNHVSFDFRAVRKPGESGSIIRLDLDASCAHPEYSFRKLSPQNVNEICIKYVQPYLAAADILSVVVC